MTAADPFDLQRFVEAQGGVYDAALAEIRAGLKTSHWMWFVFPQLAILGRSATAKRFGISGADEARAYLAHAPLGPRLVDCANAMLAHRGRSADSVLGEIDALKLKSSCTLFAAVGGGAPFEAALDAFFDGQRCAPTVTALAHA